MPNLVEFHFGYFSFSSGAENIDLQPLLSANQITDLHIVMMDNCDISVLAQMENLQTLEMSFSDINLEMANTISSISSLIELNLSCSVIHSMQDLKNLVNLKRLYLYNTLITDVNDILIFPNLTELDIHDTMINDITKLALLENLKTVYVSKSQYMTSEIEYLRNSGIDVIEYDFFEQ